MKVSAIKPALHKLFDDRPDFMLSTAGLIDRTIEEDTGTNTITAKALNQDGTLAGDVITFDTLAE